MKIWEILDIEATNDKKLIKKAYHRQLKNTHPEASPEDFMKLRTAYEEALEYAEYGADYDDYEAYEEDYYNDDYDAGYMSDDVIIISELQSEYEQWCDRVNVVYEDYAKRVDTEQWRQLLYNDIPCQFKHFHKCKEYIRYFIIDRYASVHLPKKVMNILEKFFSFSGTDIERAMAVNIYEKRRFNKKVKLNERFIFDMLITEEGSDTDIDGFFSMYEKLCDMLIENMAIREDDDNAETNENRLHNINKQIKSIKATGAYYLPFECLCIALKLEQYTKENISEIIQSFENDFGKQIYTKLLWAEYFCYCKDYKNAKILLKELYKEVLAKDYMSVWQLALCCEKAGMYHEAYMLIKQLTWLEPHKVHFQMADRIAAVIEKEYFAKVSATDDVEISDIEHIFMCRMYLRSYRNKEAAQIIEKVAHKESEPWAYNMAKCLCIFNGDDMAEATECMSVLNKHADTVGEIDKLEWEELKLRYSFEQRQYEACIRQCNELLDEYPLSYPVTFIRSYADYCYGREKEDMLIGSYIYGADKQYRDLDYLASFYPERIELRLLSAALYVKLEEYEEVLEILEPVREACWVEYEYCRLMILKNSKKLSECVDGWMSFFTTIKEQEVRTPAKSKYRLIDLKSMYKAAALEQTMLSGTALESEYHMLLKGMADSKYNNPEIYMDYSELFAYAGCYDKAIELTEQQLSKDKSQSELYKIVLSLIWNCRYGEKTDKIDEYLGYLKKDNQVALYLNIAHAYYNVNEYEKAILYFEKYNEEKGSLFPIDYVYLGYSYQQLDMHEKRVPLYKEALRRCKPYGDFVDEDNIAYNFYFSLTCAYMELKEWKLALEELEQMKSYTKLEYFKGLYSEYIARIYAEKYYEREVRGEIEAARAVEDEVPESFKVEFIGQLANVYYENDSKKTISQFYKAIDAGMREAWLYARLGEQYYIDKQYEQAIEMYKEALKIDISGNYWQWNNVYEHMYETYKALKQWDDALWSLDMMREHAAYINIRKRYKENVTEIYRYILDEYAYNADVAGGEQFFESLDDEYKECIYSSMGFLYYRTNTKPELALYYFNKAIENGYVWTYIYGALGVTYKNMGRFDEAIETFKQGIALDPTGDYWSTNLYEQLIFLYEEQENWAEVEKNALCYKNNSKAENCAVDADYHLAIAYIYSERYEEAYELWYMLKDEDGFSRANCVHNAALSLCGMGRYKEAYKLYLDVIHMDEDIVYSNMFSLIACIIRSIFMSGDAEHMKKSDIIQNIRDVLDNESTKENCDMQQLFHMYEELELILGNDKEAAKYAKKAAGASSKEDERGAEKWMLEHTIWVTGYKKGIRDMVCYVRENKLEDKLCEHTNFTCNLIEKMNRKECVSKVIVK